MNLKREKTAEILPEKFKFWGETFHTVKIKYVMSQAVEIVNSTAQGEVNLTLLSKTNFPSSLRIYFRCVLVSS